MTADEHDVAGQDDDGNAADAGGAAAASTTAPTTTVEPDAAAAAQDAPGARHLPIDADAAVAALTSPPAVLLLDPVDPDPGGFSHAVGVMVDDDADLAIAAGDLLAAIEV